MKKLIKWFKRLLGKGKHTGPTEVIICGPTEVLESKEAGTHTGPTEVL